MTDAELKAIIQAAGGKCWALEYVDALLEKINRLEAASKYASLFTQLRSAKENHVDRLCPRLDAGSES